MEAGDRGIGEEDEQRDADRDRYIEGSRYGAPRIATLLRERWAVLPANEHVEGERETCGQAVKATVEVRPGERDTREEGALVDEVNHAHDRHDPHLGATRCSGPGSSPACPPTS